MCKRDHVQACWFVCCSTARDSGWLPMASMKRLRLVAADSPAVALLQDSVLQTLDAWTEEPAYRSNAMMHLVTGIIHAAQDNYVEALRACHPGLSLEL